MKKIFLMFIMVLLVGSVFATDWKKYGTYENSNAGTYDVYFDYDATEPFDVEKEDIRYFIRLQNGYTKVEVHWYDMDENSWCAKAAKHNCYSTLEIYTNYVIEYHVNKDDTVTEYFCWK